ncbi:MAG: GNAT family N-acetyltransferase/peptidase C39 family protein [Gammaproteobacteria bacterium]|nr:GNAT family N-acetyltransferase/peptidase C39 family protein [Gammaproteobacteria bacterium]
MSAGNNVVSQNNTQLAELVIRPACLDDVDNLVLLEQRCFDYDRLSRRSFRWMLTKGKADLQIAEHNGELVAYILVLLHAGTSLARIYSLAVAPEMRGQRLADRLLEGAEARAEAKGCLSVRLEVHPDNDVAQRLYRRQGYRQFGVYPDYYEDHADALRFEKRIRHFRGVRSVEVPYYVQTTEFTCGPAALMMAMRAFDPSILFTRTLELQLWREATTIFMTAGHGGCGPHGLALAAWRRGFEVQLYINSREPLFLDGVRHEEKKSVMRDVHRAFEEELALTNVQQYYRALSTSELVEALTQGYVPLVLISSYQLARSKSPHWMVMTAADDDFVYLSDPEVDVDLHKTVLDCLDIPIRRDDFERMCQFGQSKLRTAVIIGPKSAQS